MNILDFLGGPIIGKILDKFFPDPVQKQQAQLQLLQMQQAGDFKEVDALSTIDIAQAKVNEVDAASNSFWKSGARPAVMWICATGLAYNVIAWPFLTWASNAFWHCPIPPQLDLTTSMTMLAGLLGISTQRHLERKAGVA